MSLDVGVVKSYRSGRLWEGHFCRALDDQSVADLYFAVELQAADDAIAQQQFGNFDAKQGGIAHADRAFEFPELLKVDRAAAGEPLTEGGAAHR